MTLPHTPSPDAEPRWHGRLAVVILIAGTLVVMGRLCSNDFTFWDDPGTVHQNAWLLPPTARTLVHYWMSPAFGLYIPITYTVWAAVASIAQVPKDQYGIALNPWLFHSTNVLCHLIGALVAYRILRLLNADVFGALCGALLFAVHPVQVEAVAWVSGLKDVLSGMLGLIALWQYVCFSLSDFRGRASAVRYVLATAAFVLALLAKPSAMALPLAALAIDHYGVGRPWRRVLAPALGWIFISLPLVAIARWVQDASNTWMPSLWMRPLIVTDSLAFYAWKLVWPVDLIVDYGRNPATAIALGSYRWNWIIPLGIAVFLITGARRRPVLLAAGLIFLAGCLPVLGFTPAMFQFFSTTSDHYLYLSMFGPALALAWLLSVKPALWLRLITVAGLIPLMVLSIRQGGFWQNDFTLFIHNTSVNRNSVIGYLNLGAAYDRNHDLPRALRAFENATRANPEYAMAWDNLAAVLTEQGKTQEAIAAGRHAVDLEIKYPNLRMNWKQDNDVVGRMLFDTGKFAESIPYLETAAGLEPENKLVAEDLKEAKKRAATEPAMK